MTEITIITSPSFDRRGKRRHGRFDVRVQGSDEIICKATQQPVLDASRVLCRRGFDASTVICKVRSDAPTIVTMRASIAVAAKFDVMGTAFVRRKSAAGPMPSSETESGVSAEPKEAREIEANAEARHKHLTHVVTEAPSTSIATPSRRKRK